MKEILFACTGLGNVNRGMETHVKSLFLKSVSKKEFKCFLAAGANCLENDEYIKYNDLQIIVPNISRDGRLAFGLERILGINRYFIENLSFFIALLPKLYFNKIRIIYVGDFPLYNFLFKWRKWSKASYSLVFFTGGQVIPGLFDSKRDRLHHVTDEYLSQAIEAGIPRSCQYVIPHFIIAPDRNLILESEKGDLRNRLQLPESKKIILSVGAITAGIKRMDLVIDIVSTLPDDCFLLMIGNEDFDSDLIRDRARIKLGEERFKILKVPYSEIWDHYRAADLFILGSRKESFGMVIIEALYEGLPVITDVYPASIYLLKGKGIYTDLKSAKIGQKIESLIFSNSNLDRAERREYVNTNFTWKAVEEMYSELLN